MERKPLRRKPALAPLARPSPAETNGHPQEPLPAAIEDAVAKPCPSCGKRVKVVVRVVGKQVKCPTCASLFVAARP